MIVNTLVIDGITRYYVDDYYTWDQFEQLVHYVCRQFDGVVTERLDGPGERVWYVTIDGHLIALVHNDMAGNCFFSRDAEASTILEAAARLLANVPRSALDQV